MKQIEIEEMKQSPLKEVKKRFNAFVGEVKQGNITASVDSIIVGGGHTIRLKGEAENYSIDITIRKRINERANR